MGQPTTHQPRAAQVAGSALLAAIPLACGGLACGGSDRTATPAVALPAPIPPPTAALETPAERPAPPALPDFSDAAWNRVESRAGTYLVHWRSLTGKVPRNEDFGLEVWVLRAGAPVREAHLDVHAWMPDHGHGMLRQTRAEQQPDGSYRVEGMLLHMRGHWQLFFDLLEGTTAETAECAVEL